MISIRLRRLYLRLSHLIGLVRDCAFGMHGIMPLSLESIAEPGGVISSVAQDNAGDECYGALSCILLHRCEPEGRITAQQTFRTI